MVEKNKIIIRNGRIKDQDEVLKLWQEFTGYHIKISSLDLEFNENAPEIFLKYYLNHVRSSTKKAFVAEEGGVIVGYLLGQIRKRPPVYKTTHQGHITDMMVCEDKRKMGIGTLLVEEFVTWARHKGTKFITLDVLFENEVGLKFWEKQNFETANVSKFRNI